jgi:hypothetical protein
MSADNGVYVLKTIRSFKQSENGSWERVQSYPVYRIAIASAIDNFYYYKENQLHNLGAYMTSTWKDSPLFDDYGKAIQYAHSLESVLPICEYGVCLIDTDYTFYGDM